MYKQAPAVTVHTYLDSIANCCIAQFALYWQSAESSRDNHSAQKHAPARQILSPTTLSRLALSASADAQMKH
jgi:hypothetical protein